MPSHMFESPVFQVFQPWIIKYFAVQDYKDVPLIASSQSDWICISTIFIDVARPWTIRDHVKSDLPLPIP